MHMLHVTARPRAHFWSLCNHKPRYSSKPGHLEERKSRARGRSARACGSTRPAAGAHCVCVASLTSMRRRQCNERSSWRRSEKVTRAMLKTLEVTKTPLVGRKSTPECRTCERSDADRTSEHGATSRSARCRRNASGGTGRGRERSTRGVAGEEWATVGSRAIARRERHRGALKGCYFSKP